MKDRRLRKWAVIVLAVLGVLTLVAGAVHSRRVLADDSGPSGQSSGPSGQGSGPCPPPDGNPASIDACLNSPDFTNEAAAAANIGSVPLGCVPKPAKVFAESGKANQMECELVFGEPYSEFYDESVHWVQQRLLVEAKSAYNDVAKISPNKTFDSVCLLSDGEGVPSGGDGVSTPPYKFYKKIPRANGDSVEGPKVTYCTQDSYSNAVTCYISRDGLGDSFFSEGDLKCVGGSVNGGCPGGHFQGYRPPVGDNHDSATYFNRTYENLHGALPTGQSYQGKKNWPEGGTCGKFCTFDVDNSTDPITITPTNDSDSCRLENNWIRGAWFYSKFAFKNKILGDGKPDKSPAMAAQVFKSPTDPNYVLTGFGASKPCGAVAHDIITTTDAIRSYVALLSKRFPAHEANDPQYDVPPDYEGKGRYADGFQNALDLAQFSAECYAPVSKSDPNPQASHVLNKDPLVSRKQLCRRKDLIDFLVKKKTSGGKPLPDSDQYVAPGTLSITLARIALRYMWMNFFYCEITANAQKVFFQQEPAKMLNGILGSGNDSYAGQMAKDIDECKDKVNCPTVLFNNGYRDRIYEIVRDQYWRISDLVGSSVAGVSDNLADISGVGNPKRNAGSLPVLQITDPLPVKKDQLDAPKPQPIVKAIQDMLDQQDWINVQNALKPKPPSQQQ